MATTPRKKSTVRKTNWFAIWVSAAAVVAIVVIAGVVIWMNNAASGPGTQPTADHINTETGAISFGTGKGTMDNYIDLMCPICQQFEESYGSSIQSLVSDKTITLRIHPISILDGQSQGTEYSSRAASAVYAVAVADYSNVYAFIQAMYTNKPEEQSTGLTDAQIIDIAKNAGVNMTSDLEKAINSNRYVKYVQYMTPKTPIAPGSSGIGTPTIAINDKVIANSTLPQPDQLATLFK